MEVLLIQKEALILKMNPGTYDISFEFISFKTIKLTKKVVNQSINFGTIELFEDSEIL